MFLRILILATALFVFAFTAGAVASGKWYWSRTGAIYKCEGTYLGSKCKATEYNPTYAAWFVKNSAKPEGAVIVSYAGTAIFGCELNFTPAANCEYYGP